VARLLARGTSRRRVADIDLLRQRARPWRASWVALAAALACAVGASRHLAAAQDRVAIEEAAAARAASLQRRARPPARPAVPAAPAAAAAELSALQAGADLLAARSHPWADVFAGVEEASRGVAMLSWKHQATQASIDLDVAVAGDDAAWAFAERLSADTSRFDQATLVSRDRLEPAQAGLTVRARVEAVLKGGRASAEARSW
jgi:hypothetical protein